jgi:cysteine desulfurase family protein (TIGR01976 family)
VGHVVDGAGELSVHRDRFPGLQGEWARLDGPAGTQALDTVIAAIGAFMASGDSANAHGAFAAAEATDALVARARRTVAELFGGTPRGVVFGPSMTSLTLAFSAAVGRTLRPGDEIVLTRLDHDGNVAPWLIAAERAGATVRWAEPPDRASLALPAEAVARHLTGRTRWVAVTAASNAIGTVPDLAGIVAAAHDAGARVYVDAVHHAPHRRISVAGLGCDVLACSPYKWFGPHAGVLVARDPELLAELDPDKLRPSPDTVPERWETGTPAFEVLAGITAAAEYLLGLDWEAVREHEEALLARLLDGLRATRGVTVHGDAPDRTATVMFTLEGRTSVQVAEHLASRRVAVWHGNYYALELSRFLGLEPDGAVRAGLVHYNEAWEVDRLLAGVAELAGARAAA